MFANYKQTNEELTKSSKETRFLLNKMFKLHAEAASSSKKSFSESPEEVAELGFYLRTLFAQMQKLNKTSFPARDFFPNFVQVN